MDVWDARNLRPIGGFTTDGVTALGLQPGRELLATADGDGVVRIWSVTTG
ncbi:hypothetical protein Actkin_04601 [Actinokineospora sp. UTMC 2448]|nr:hypothetical protein [Actinokineospora sp. UTMC 2448]UVS80849.1 hypothetical protein Actkin_04601 [Actinokineospora sp. UTMC 2448]